MSKTEAIAEGKKLLEECEAAGGEFVRVLRKRVVTVLGALTADKPSTARKSATADEDKPAGK